MQCLPALSRRYDSDVVSVNLPRNNHAVVINDPVLAKELFNTGTDLVERPPSGAGSIGEAFGPGSTFSLAGDEHRERRKLLAPPFHGKRMRSYDRIIEEEVMREIATWPEGREFETLRADAAHHRRRDPARGIRRRRDSRWKSFAKLCRRWSRSVACSWCARRSCARTWVRGVRGGATEAAAPLRRRHRLADRRGAGRPGTRKSARTCWRCCCRPATKTASRSRIEHIADELLTLLGSGHETTASSLAWALERLSRHPRAAVRGWLRKPTPADPNCGRPRSGKCSAPGRFSTATTRRTKTRIRLGDWVLPEGTNIIISINAGP